ncbi:hypothetical protein ACLKA6_009772 [Drosophila palustris]
MENPILRQEYTELRREVKGIKTSVEELKGDVMAALENMSKTIKSELSFVVETLATQSAYIKQIAKRDATSTEGRGQPSQYLRKRFNGGGPQDLARK